MYWADYITGNLQLCFFYIPDSDTLYKQKFLLCCKQTKNSICQCVKCYHTCYNNGGYTIELFQLIVSTNI